MAPPERPRSTKWWRDPFWQWVVGLLIAVLGIVVSVGVSLYLAGKPPFAGKPSSTPLNPTPSLPSTSATPTPSTPPINPTPTSPPFSPSRCTVFDVSPQIALSRASAPKGAAVTVTGTGFCPADIVDIFVHLSPAGSPTTDSRGNLTYTITVPQSAPPPGFPTEIRADSRSNRGNASAPFTMG
jgi:hypothetical protein